MENPQRLAISQEAFFPKQLAYQALQTTELLSSPHGFKSILQYLCHI
jgi:hypothetical protein